jgi:hypothetical protein
MKPGFKGLQLNILDQEGMGVIGGEEDCEGLPPCIPVSSDEWYPIFQVWLV